MKNWIEKDDKFENECNKCCMKCDELDKCENNCMINLFHIWCKICSYEFEEGM